MSLTFKNAGHLTELELILELIERLENAAYQAERLFWDMAGSEWEAQQSVAAHDARDLSDALCATAQPICRDILERLAKLCNEYTEPWTHITLDPTLSFYAGGKYLEQKLDTNAGTLNPGGIQIITLDQGLQESAETLAKIPTAIAITEALRKKMVWLQHWIWNAHRKSVWTAYEAVLANVYAYVYNLINTNLGPNFPTPITSYYSTAAGATYKLPKILADASVAGLLTLKCVNDYTAPGTYTAPQGATTGFHQIAASDTVHLAKLDVTGYEAYADKVYTVNAVDANSLTLNAPAETLLPPCISEPSLKFGDIFVIRKLRSAT